VERRFGEILWWDDDAASVTKVSVAFDLEFVFLGIGIIEGSIAMWDFQLADEREFNRFRYFRRLTLVLLSRENLSLYLIAVKDFGCRKLHVTVVRLVVLQAKF
jgi:hypothetical protein